MIISSDPKIQAQPRSTRRLEVLTPVPECVAVIGERTYRFIDPSWQPESGHPMHPEYQSPAWAAHEVLVCEPEQDIWRTLTEAEIVEMNGTLWPEVYEAIRQWARGVI